VDQVRAEGIVNVVQEALELASKGCDAVYVSVDTDVLDISFSPGTSIPSPGGLSAQELLDAMAVFSQTPIVRAMDIVELNPHKDTDSRQGITIQVATDTVIAFLTPRLFEYC